MGDGRCLQAPSIWLSLLPTPWAPKEDQSGTTAASELVFGCLNSVQHRVEKMDETSSSTVLSRQVISDRLLTENVTGRRAY